jgi:membrane-bound metal-dependent hydrolase YbcI (DUF457 family)
MTLRSHGLAGIIFPVFFLNPLNDMVVYVAFVIGNLMPDLLDNLFSLGSHKIWGKIHRKFSHWWVIYVILIALYKFDILQGAIGLIIFWFSLGCLSHLLLDLFTKSGIPMIHPFKNSKTIGIRIIRTGDVFSEFFIVCIISFLLFVLSRGGNGLI